MEVLWRIHTVCQLNAAGYRDFAGSPAPCHRSSSSHAFQRDGDGVAVASAGPAPIARPESMTGGRDSSHGCGVATSARRYELCCEGHGVDIGGLCRGAAKTTSDTNPQEWTTRA